MSCHTEQTTSPVTSLLLFLSSFSSPSEHLFLPLCLSSKFSFKKKRDKHPLLFDVGEKSSREEVGSDASCIALFYPKNCCLKQHLSFLAQILMQRRRERERKEKGDFVKELSLFRSKSTGNMQETDVQAFLLLLPDVKDAKLLQKHVQDSASLFFHVSRLIFVFEMRIFLKKNLLSSLPQHNLVVHRMPDDTCFWYQRSIFLIPFEVNC